MATRGRESGQAAARMTQITAAAATLAVGLAVMALAPARAITPFAVVPGIFDPSSTGSVSAAWLPGVGLGDAVGANAYGLALTKTTLTATNASSGATVTGVAGITLTELGFDWKSAAAANGHCGGGAPRFNVTTTPSTGVHFIGCSAGTHTVNTPVQGWERVRFDPTTQPPTFPPLASNAVVDAIEIVFDEGTDQGSGQVLLDNIDINGTLIGQPAPAPTTTAVTAAPNAVASGQTVTRPAPPWRSSRARSPDRSSSATSRARSGPPLSPAGAWPP